MWSSCCSSSPIAIGGGLIFPAVMGYGPVRRAKDLARARVLAVVTILAVAHVCDRDGGCGVD